MNALLAVAVIVCSVIAAKAVLPAAFNSTRDHFNSRWVLSIAEVFSFPTSIWRTNLGVVADYIGSYYTWAVALFFAGFTWLALRRKNFPELTLAGMCLAGAMRRDVSAARLQRIHVQHRGNRGVVASPGENGRASPSRPLNREDEFSGGGRCWQEVDSSWLIGPLRTS